MLHPVKMKRIRALIFKESFDDVIHALAETRSFQPIEMAPEIDASEGLLEAIKPTEINYQAVRLISEIDRVLKILKVEEKPVPEERMPKERKPLKQLVEDVVKAVTSVEEKYEELNARAQKVADLPDDYWKKRLVVRQFKKLSEEEGPKLLLLRSLLNSEKEVEEAKFKLAETRFNSFVEGWVPASAESEVVGKIKEASKGSCLIDVIEPGEHDQVPTLIENRPFIKPFERLIKAYGIQSYKELDPTIVVSITFPIIFGTMFADLGHGLLFVILGAVIIFMRKKMKEEPGEMLGYGLNNGSIFLLAGISSVFWSLVFGEVFGYHFEHFGFEHPPLAFILEYIPTIGGPFIPMERPRTMLKFAFIVGTAFISIGIILNLANKLMQRNFKEAFFESICWLWFYLGLMSLALTFKFNIGLWTQKIDLVAVAVILPLVLMLLGKSMTGDFIEGFGFTFEAFVSSISNTVSFGRILALSLVHSGMSLMFSQLAGFPPSGAGIMVLAIGTFLVMFFEGLIIFVHTTRLHWVEWFSKFYKGDGIEFKPIKSAGG